MGRYTFFVFECPLHAGLRHSYLLALLRPSNHARWSTFRVPPMSSGTWFFAKPMDSICFTTLSSLPLKTLTRFLSRLPIKILITGQMTRKKVGGWQMVMQVIRTGNIPFIASMSIWLSVGSNCLNFAWRGHATHSRPLFWVSSSSKAAWMQYQNAWTIWIRVNLDAFWLAGFNKTTPRLAGPFTPGKTVAIPSAIASSFPENIPSWVRGKNALSGPKISSRLFQYLTNRSAASYKIITQMAG